MKTRFALGLALATVSATAAPAAAQSLRPNILVVFDTSGSMQLDASESWAGERVNESAGSCPAVPAGKVSRLYSLKAALREALAQVGTDEANFGLMSFPQLVDPTLTQPPATNDPTRGTNGFGCFSCTSEACGTGPVGHYYLDSTVGLGCRISTDPVASLNSVAAEPAYGPWFDSAISQALRVDLTKAAPGSKPVAADFDPADANIPRIYQFIDNTENPGPVANLAALTDPELHANGGTPLGRSLFYARLYYDNFINTSADPRRACRQNIVILVTDGNDTCDSVSGSALDYQTCASTGFSTFHPEVQACKLLRSNSKVKTYVITDTNVSGNLNSNIAIAGGTGGAIKVSLTDTAAVKAALVGIIAATVPPSEVCNGKDDNCNGQIDEGVSNMCPRSDDPSNADNQKGPAAAHCAVEACNCKDDNCDGVVDEGLPTNACGGPCGCAVPTEICDGLDNNCDGNIDEGFFVGASCTNNQLGACRRGGILACKADGTGTYCDAPVVTPSTEVCNNIDDDCNGKTDDGMNLPGVGEMCGAAVGICKAGTTVCMNGHLVCEQMSTPMPEVCNNVDDDCNGIPDDGVLPGTGDDCLCPGTKPEQVGVGVCKGGKTACRGGKIVCEGCVGPSAEICDGKDNDCDGKVDTQTTCPSGLACREGACTIQCRSGEFPCPAGYMCVDTFCIPQRCVGVTCPSGQRCDNDTGLCIDSCAKVTCTAPAYCKAGQCVNCNSPGESCAADQMCLGGACMTDPCKGVKCGTDQYCSNGACVNLCTSIECSATQTCVAGQCVDNPCLNKGCNQDQFCDMKTGECKTDTCQGLQCPAGQVCIQSTGACVLDPCATVQCPSPCFGCMVTSGGDATCKFLSDADHPQCQVLHVTTGQRGGGCSCDVGSGADLPSGIALGFAALGLVMTARQRRRRRA
ncbi:MAG TPA: MopE-related protein [Polyangia bacterium]|jgi:MYXO-CTERM domain-containing protein|nr:MopE-related protein [Polyangia bacterium]